MSNNPSDPGRDEMLLIDFLLDRAGPEESREAQRRLASDEAFRRLKENLAHAFAALDLLPEAQVPANLVARTVARVGLARKTDAYLARQETARPWAVSVFSLRELVAVAASILLIVSVFVPSLRQAHRKALQGQCASNVGQIGAALSSYASQNSEHLPTVMGQKAQWLAAGNQPVVSNSAALFKLINAKLVAPQVFQCPAVGRGGFVVRVDMTDFPGGQFISYSYDHTGGPDGPLRRDQFTPAEQEARPILADSSPLFQGGAFHPEKVNAATSENHGEAGQNVLYINPAVRWVNQPDVGINNDNIFKAGSLNNYSGNELPTNRDDTVLMPNFVPSQDANR